MLDWIKTNISGNLPGILGVLGFFISLYNVWKGLDKEMLEIDIAQADVDADFKYRIVLVNKGNVPLTVTSIDAVFHWEDKKPVTVNFQSLLTAQNIITVKPKEAATIDVSKYRLVRDAEFVITTTRGKKYSKMIVPLPYSVLWSNHLADKAVDILKKNVNSERNWSSMRHRIHSHLLNGMKAEGEAVSYLMPMNSGLDGNHHTEEDEIAFRYLAEKMPDEFTTTVHGTSVSLTLSDDFRKRWLRKSGADEAGEVRRDKERQERLKKRNSLRERLSRRTRQAPSTAQQDDQHTRA